MAVVTLRNLRKLYPDGHTAVKDFSLEVGDGEFVVFVGPSGCGKSTTLRMVAGLEEISSGELVIDGKIANALPPKERDIAMVFQNYALYPHMTVRENMGFALKLAGVAGAEIARRVLEAAKTLQLETVLERKPAALSGGQRQRVALGRALVREPKVFLMDEPLSNLDAQLRAEMRASISRLQRRLGATTIYVTHDQVEAMTMGDRIVVMRDGEIQQVAAPIELYERPANRFVAGFIGSPAMGFLRVRHEAGVLVGQGFRLALPAALRARFDPGDAQELWLGVRPEAITVAGTDASADFRLHGIVEVVEPLGAETIVAVVVGDERLVARLAGHHVLRAGSAVELALDPQRLHLFDLASERRLERAA